MKKKFSTIKIGLLPVMAELYRRLFSKASQQELGDLVITVSKTLTTDTLKICNTPVSASKEDMESAFQFLDEHNIDLLIVAFSPYSPSGILVPFLEKFDRPVLLWPMQSMCTLEPENYHPGTTRLSHGIHGVQDTANILRKRGRAFGVIHGHYTQPSFHKELYDWARAARAAGRFGKSNPCQVGGYFDAMLDLQIGHEKMFEKIGLKPTIISQKQFIEAMDQPDASEKDCLERYRALFEIAPEITDEMLEQTARKEAALRRLMADCNSHACGINFLNMCNDGAISDGLHVAASVLMQEGHGYAGEGDWVTAAFVYAMQQGFGIASFSEIFSMCHTSSRIVLKHWGEGNIEMARKKPRMIPSTMNDQQQCYFLTADFEFNPGPATLVNLNSTPQQQGQIISIEGTILDQSLPRSSGPRAIFQPVTKDINALLNNYAYSGGSHHLALVPARAGEVLEKMARFNEWRHVNL